MNNKVRYLIIMTIGVCMNQFLYSICMALELPFWMDMSGTIFAALILEPTAGLLVGLINNFVLAVFYYDSSSLIFYAVSAAAALIVGVKMRKNGKIVWKQTVPTVILLVLVTGLLTGILSIWEAGCALELTHPWEVHFLDYFSAAGVPRLLGYFMSTLLVKAFDAIGVAAVIAILYKVLPKKIICAPEMIEQNSTK